MVSNSRAGTIDALSGVSELNPLAMESARRPLIHGLKISADADWWTTYSVFTEHETIIWRKSGICSAATEQ